MQVYFVRICCICWLVRDCGELQLRRRLCSKLCRKKLTHNGHVQDPNERRGGVGTVAAGDDAEQMAVGYQLGYAPREVTIDFQV